MVMPTNQAHDFDESRLDFWVTAMALPVLSAPAWHRATGNLAIAAPLGTFAGLILTYLLLTSAVTDAGRGKIYNWATYPALLWALAINVLGVLPGASSPWWLAHPLGAIGPGACLLGGFACF